MRAKVAAIIAGLLLLVIAYDSGYNRALKDIVIECDGSNEGFSIEEVGRFDCSRIIESEKTKHNLT